MLIKAFSEVGRNNYEVAIIPLWGDWLKKSLETTDLLEILNVESYSGLSHEKNTVFPSCCAGMQKNHSTSSGSVKKN